MPEMFFFSTFFFLHKSPFLSLKKKRECLNWTHRVQDVPEKKLPTTHFEFLLDFKWVRTFSETNTFNLLYMVLFDLLSRQFPGSFCNVPYRGTRFKIRSTQALTS